MINSLGFIGHPIDMEHFYKMMGPLAAAVRKISPFHFKEFFKHIPSYRLSTVRDIRSSKSILIDCHIIICPLLPEDMVGGCGEEFVLNRIIQAVRRAEKLGAKIVTLGGFTSVIGDEGEVVSKRVNIAVTNGNTYTASLAIDGILKAAYYMDVDLPNATLAVIGATGDIGSICTKILAKKVGRPRETPLPK